MNRIYKIYALIDPTNNKPFYVGATMLTLRLRLNLHCVNYDFEVVNKSYTKERSILIQGWKAAGLKPKIVVLREVAADKIDYYEKYYYDLFTSMGHKLLQTNYQFVYSLNKKRFINDNLPR